MPAPELPRPLGETLSRAVMFALAGWIAFRTVENLRLVWSFDTDDAFITLRYARNLYEGVGLTWNAGEPPVEGYSNFAYVLAGAAFLASGVDPMQGLKVLSCLGLLVSSGVLFWLARRWTRSAFALLPALWLTSYDGTLLWTVSGLETATYQALFVSSVALTIGALGYPAAGPDAQRSVRPPRARWLAGAGAVAFLAALMRPEGPLLIPVILLCVVCQLLADLRGLTAGDTEARRATARGYVRAILGLLAAFGLPYLLYTVFRVAHFGELLPNTVQCKAAYHGPPQQLDAQYLEYARGFLLLGLAVPIRRLDARHVLLWVPVLLYLVVLFGVDPIVSYDNRHFLAAHALVLVAAAVGVSNLVEWVLEERFARLRGPALVALMLLVGAPRGVGPDTPSLERWTRTYRMRSTIRHRLGEWLDARLTPEERYVIGDCGLVPYVTRARVIDAYCLNSSVMTRPPIDGSTERYVEWIFGESPEVVVVHSSTPNALRPRPEYGFYPALVAHPEFARRYVGVERFTARSGGFHYFVFARRDFAEALRARAPSP